MSALALDPQALRPRDEAKLGAGLSLALLAHGVLIAALTAGLNWKLPKQDVVVAAELWSAVPQAAAPAPAPPPPDVVPPAPTPAPTPAPPAPPPTPPQPTAAEREAEIALEKAALRKKEQQAQEAAERAAKAKLEAERERKAKEEADRKALEAATLRQQKKLEEKRLADEQAAKLKKEQQAKDEKLREEKRLAAEQQAREAKAQEAQIAKQREQNLKRMMGEAAVAGTGGANANGTAAREGAPSAAYAGRIKARIKPNLLLVNEVTGNPTTEVEIKCAPDGTIVGSRVVKPSGNKAWDDAVLRAIEKTGNLPRDTDGRIPATMVLVYSRQE